MNVDDDTNAMNQLDSMHDYQDRRIAAEEQYCNEFISLALKGDVGAVAEFAPMRTDYSAKPNANKQRPMRPQTLADVMEYALDLGRGGPSHKEVMQLILNVALGQAQQDVAHEMLCKMAAKAAEQTVEVE